MKEYLNTEDFKQLNFFLNVVGVKPPEKIGCSEVRTGIHEKRASENV